MDEDDIKYMKMAIEEAKKCSGEDSRTHPKVGAVVVLNGTVIATAHRGEVGAGDHAEFTALEKKLSTNFVSGATVYTTLEPCTTRNHPKIPCAYRLIERRVKRVVIGMLDPNPDICGKGLWLLRDSNVATDLFPNDLMCEIEELNREFIREHRPKNPQFVSGAAAAALASASEEPAKDADTANIAVVDAGDVTLFDKFMDAMKSGDIVPGEKLYEELLTSEPELPPLVKLQLRVVYLDYCYRATQDPDVFAQIENMVSNENIGDFAAARLGHIMLLGNDLNGAADYFAKATAIAKSPDSRLTWVLDHARTLQKQDAALEAISLLFSHVSADYSRDGKAKLLRALSAIFDNRNEKYMSAALLARAAQMVPADNSIRFSAAYALGQIGFGHLSLTLYDCLRQSGNDDPLMLNNLGAQCNNLGMPIKATKFLRKAADLGTTLASATLAFNYASSPVTVGEFRLG